MVALPFQNLLLAISAHLANNGVAVEHFTPGARALVSLGNAIPLRIMPLGASITWGQGSSDGNGYRAELRLQITRGGNKVNMVGSRRNGNMIDADVEGWPGLRIEQVHSKAITSVPQSKPNVFLINAGTNDALQNANVSTAGSRMETMLTDLYGMSPRATVVLSTLIINRNPDAERNVVNINSQFTGLVQKLRRQGRRIVLADMHGPNGPSSSDLVDDTHPNDTGYRKMANVWMLSLISASDQGFLRAAENVPGLPDDGNL